MKCAVIASPSSSYSNITNSWGHILPLRNCVMDIGGQGFVEGFLDQNFSSIEQLSMGFLCLSAVIHINNQVQLSDGRSCSFDMASQVILQSRCPSWAKGAKFFVWACAGIDIAIIALPPTRQKPNICKIPASFRWFSYFEFCILWHKHMYYWKLHRDMKEIL